MHGDTACYGALVSTGPISSYQYLHHQGNWGTLLEGDSPAAMRYTECKVSNNYTNLYDLESMNSAPTVPNFDGTIQEPYLIISKIPMLLLNDTWGNTVGYSSNIPSHNQREVIEACIASIKAGYKLKPEKLAKILQAPDHRLYPCRYIIDQDEWLNIMSTGNGKVTSAMVFEAIDDGIHITAIPHGAKLQDFLNKYDKISDKHDVVRETIDRTQSDIVDITVIFKRTNGKNAELNQKFVDDLVQSTKTNVFYKVLCCKQIENETISLGDGSTWELLQLGLDEIINEHNLQRRKYKLISLKNQIVKIDRSILIEMLKLEISKDPDRFFKIITEAKSTSDAITECSKRKEYNYERDIIEYVVKNSTFDSFINKNEKIKDELEKLKAQKKKIEDRIQNIDEYLIEELKAIPQVERRSEVETFKLDKVD